MTQRAEQVRAKVMSPDQASITDQQSTPLVDHVNAHLDDQRQKQTSPDRIKNYETRLNESADGCRFRLLCDLSADRLEKWLSEQRDGDRKMSASVYNGYREAWMAFGVWCIGKRVNKKQTHFNGEKRLLVNPFDGMAKLDEQADRRRTARALTEGELSRLLDAAKRRPLLNAMTIWRGPNKGKPLAKVAEHRVPGLQRLGHQRAMIYKTAVLTGLRADELRALECRDLSFGDVPFVTLRHSNEKNHKGSTLALRSDLAVDLQSWIQNKQPTDRVFDVPDGILRIMNRDIELAGIPKKDTDGLVVHVHALRHSFGTHLSKAGVAPRVAQKAMRHSNIGLTTGTYTDARLLDTTEAMELLPSLPIDGTPPRMVAPTVAPNVGKQGKSESIPDHSGALADDDAANEKPRKTRGATGFFGSGQYRIRICDLYDVNEFGSPTANLGFYNEHPVLLVQ